MSVRAWIVATVAAAALVACGAEDEVTVEPEAERLEIGVGDIVRYGDAPQQFAELKLPDESSYGDGPYPVVVFIHGGFWRNAFDLSLAQPQAADARSNGYATWNIEYRRVGDPGGGYPGTLDDVGAAIDALARVDAPVDLDRVAVVGHSAGGHLALWVGQRDDPAVTPKLVVGQAPVADLGNSLELGRGAVMDFMGGTPDELPDAYDAADPARGSRFGYPNSSSRATPTTSFRSTSSEPYAETSGADFLVFDGADHFDVIDPAHPSWAATLVAIGDAGGEAVPSD